MKRLALTTLTACLLAGPVLAAPGAPDTTANGPVVLANCPGKPPVNA